jgi:16S rRNA (cytosine1402-N4)-methyltransferase
MGLAATNRDKVPARLHEPVMVAEVCGLMLVQPPPVLVVDATVGAGGHAEALLTGGCRRLIGLDRDDNALAAAQARLAQFGDRVVLRQANFADLDSVLDELDVDAVDGILADFGMSSLALDDPLRGFSFRFDGPLDMRMDRREQLRAYDIVNEEPEEELARIIAEYGEERHARRIARHIVAARRRRPLESTSELSAVIASAVGGRRGAGIHPATRTFQALRIVVNREMESLERFLQQAPRRLAPGGRLTTLAYHSLEDRPIKNRMRELVHEGSFRAVSGRAIRPGGAEIARNPRARSARLRCIERGSP